MASKSAVPPLNWALIGPLRSLFAVHFAKRDRKGPMSARLKKKGRLLAALMFDVANSSQPFTLSFSALAMVIFTTLSASLWICSPVAGLRTMRSGRSRQ